MEGGRISSSPRKVAYRTNKHPIDGRAIPTRPTTRSGVIWKVGC